MKYTLKNDDLTVEFSTFGGEITSIRDSKGLEYLWQGDKTYWKGQAPVLFPIVGSLRNRKAVIGGDKTCFMERHGVARQLEFDKENIEEDSITFSALSDERTKERYPYDFQLLIRYVLNENNITTVYTVVNRSDIVMPFQIGGHPGFNCPLTDRESFGEYVVEFEREETADCPLIDSSTGLVNVEDRKRVLDHSKILELDHALFRTDALIFDQLFSKKVKLYNPKNGRGVQMEFSDFKNLLVWSSANNGPFVALEPWTGLATCSDEGDVFEQKRGVYLLTPNDSRSFSYTITVLKEEH
jgi:galactose mutarotase-like enzyme